MSWHKQSRSRQQRKLRERRGERAFLFDKDFSQCFGEMDRDDWELAISANGGNVLAAGDECGLRGLPRGAKALWGRSAEEALGTYRRWLRKRSK